MYLKHCLFYNGLLNTFGKQRHYLVMLLCWQWCANRRLKKNLVNTFVENPVAMKGQQSATFQAMSLLIYVLMKRTIARYITCCILFSFERCHWCECGEFIVLNRLVSMLIKTIYFDKVNDKPSPLSGGDTAVDLSTNLREVPALGIWHLQTKCMIKKNPQRII